MGDINMTSKKYNFKTHSEISNSLKDYIISVSNERDIEGIPIEDINNFLNGVETWDAEDELFEAIADMSPNRSRSMH